MGAVFCRGLWRRAVDVLAAYVRPVDLFNDHAGAAFL